MTILRTIRLAAVVAVFLSSGSALAFDVLIDDFSAAVNTTQKIGPAMESDTGLTGVLGGSRDLEVGAGTVFVQSGIIPASQTDPLGLFDYMSIGTGSAVTRYNGGGNGLGRAIALCTAIEVTYLNADDAAQGNPPDPVLIGVTMTSGAVGINSFGVVNAPAGVLTYPLADFSSMGVDLQNLDSIDLAIEAFSSQDADLAIDSIRAVGCTLVPSPSPAMGAGPLAMGTLLLAGLGLLGVARRRTL